MHTEENPVQTHDQRKRDRDSRGDAMPGGLEQRPEQEDEHGRDDGGVEGVA